MKLAFWNIRGMNSPLKQNGIREFIKQRCIDIMGILETKLGDQKLMRILRNKFDGFMYVNNFGTHRAGRILILWNPSKAFLDVMEVYPQIIHCKATCKVTSYTFLVSFVYGFHTVVNRRPLWNNIMEFNASISSPWLILGDYNNVLKFDEKCNGADVTPYEIKDLKNCCLHEGLMDMWSIGCYYTWTDGSVWNKIDRAMINDIWVQNGAYVVANFLPSSCLSEHSPCVVSGTKQFILCKQLSKLKEDLKELKIKHFGHISTRANEAKIELEAAQLQLHNQPKNVDFQLLVAKLRKKVIGLCEAERSFYYQKTKCIFLKQSDKCTKFFHSVVKMNSRRNFIASILKEDGMYTTSQDQVALEFVNFYTNLLGKYEVVRPIDNDIICNGPLVSLEQGNALVRDISIEENKESLFGIGDDKSPGSDGYTSCFFKRAWGQINHVVIALVPKSTHAPSVGNYRQISCCNVIYKVITKILASRLRPILRDIVDQKQAAFIKGRSMMENIHLARELMRQYNRKRVAPRRLLKIDSRKAYDSVSWNFLKSVLEGLNFPLRFVQWIMECVTTPTYFIALNGSMHGFFKGGKGLRQGDPLSSFLFMFCLEYFSRMIKDAKNYSEFSYYPKCGLRKITHLAFTNDLLLFAKGDAMSVEILMNCLNKFGLTLGIHLASEKLKVSSYASLLEKIAADIGAWNCSSISYAEKMELIRAVLQGVECFWLSIFPIPTIIISRIKDLCLPKEEEGLGLKDLKSWNLVLLVKSLWNIQHKNEVRPTKYHSPPFKKLLEIRDILHEKGVGQ
ncbi:uncharacterized protein LOC111370020 [Olea europaea var. sylvestris]|uniref:uncharacterized protein LOC111370020 n=1 Tax=Olea europaea var. sylvestris TaxID=158386 RepID=UPI000C1D1E09|nr:uncharacterized protein LOC111370020 [Olea europaea var. sylvestris]